jgi:hypothetical protein
MDMAASVKIEDAIGTVDGTNKDFQTSIPYVPGSLEVFVNGVLNRNQDIDGWTESLPKSFRMKEAPDPPDRLRVFYRW